MPILCELWVYRDGRGPAPDETMFLEGVPEAIRRMQEIRTEHPEASFRFMASSVAPEYEINDLFRRSIAAGLTLERTLPDPEEDVGRNGRLPSPFENL